MIKVEKVLSNNFYKKISIKGHANYDTYGKDIVCASVSSIITTTINAILRLKSDSISFKEDDGNVEINVLYKDETVNILIENMLCILDDLASDYPKNIKIL